MTYYNKMTYIIPAIFAQPHNVLEIKRQPKKALRIINQSKDINYKKFLMKIFIDILHK